MIAEKLNIKVAVITDNDSNYDKNIKEKYDKYKDFDNIKVFAETNNDLRTFEISLYNNNIKYLNDNKVTTSTNIQKFMLNNKSENAYRILEKLDKRTENFVIPEYIEKAIRWIKS